MKLTKSWLAAAVLAALTGTAQAALVSNADGTVTDTNTNLIWLQDWNVNGIENWSTQKAWAEGLDFAGSTDWELPEDSEYRALFAAYGNLEQVAEFTNVDRVYWSGTEVIAGSTALFFQPQFGNGSFLGQGAGLRAVAVRPGDMTAAVPEPQTLALALLALGVTVVARRRRPR